LSANVTVTEIRVLGAVELQLADGTCVPVKDTTQARVLTLLALSAGKDVNARDLLQEFYPANLAAEEKDIKWEALKKAIGQSIAPIFFETETARLDINPKKVDVLNFCELCKAVASADDAEKCIALWRGKPQELTRRSPWANMNKVRDQFIETLLDFDLAELPPQSAICQFLDYSTPKDHPKGLELRSRVVRPQSVSGARPASPKLMGRPLDADLLDRDEPTLTWAEVANGIVDLVGQLADWHPDRIIGINRGGAIVGGMLAKALQIRYIAVISIVEENGHFRIEEAPTIDERPARIVIVDEARRSGRHLAYAETYVRAEFTKSEVRLMTLVDTAYVSMDSQRPTLSYSAYSTRLSSVLLPWDVL